MTVSVVAGGFWGDEGKGKIAAYLSLTRKPTFVARAGVGPNAGHTVVWQSHKHVMRLVPAGFLEPTCRLLIGAGVLIDPDVLIAEVERLAIHDGRLGVDPHCAVITPDHIQRDRTDEHLARQVGTTGTGTGPANQDRAARRAPLARDLPQLVDYLQDVPKLLNEAAARGDDILVEGSQGFALSLYYGDYPYVTSKDTTVGSLAADVGLAPRRLDEVVIVFKSYASRVGEGPFATELPQAEAERRGWQEFGAVTGRPRRIGEFDFDLAARAVMINGATQIALTNLDRRFRGASGARRWTDLPAEAQDFVRQVESRLSVPVTLVSTGAEVEDMVER
jgi:adenylosuccinate synthase